MEGGSLEPPPGTGLQRPSGVSVINRAKMRTQPGQSSGGGGERRRG